MTTTKWSLLCGVLIGIIGLIGCQQSAQTVAVETDAENVTEISWTTSSEQAKSNFLSALQLSEIGNNQEARAIFSKVIEEDPSFAMAYLHRAFTASSAEEYAKDIKKAGSLLEGLDDAEKRMIAIATTSLSSDYDQELLLSKEFVAAYPNLPRAQNWLGYAYQNLDQQENARAAFQKAVNMNPKWAGAYVPLGMSYIFDEPKDLLLAQENLSKSLALVPNDAMANINMGDCYRAENDLENARRYYTKAAELNPKESIAHSKAGHVNSLLGNYEEARVNYQKSRALSDFKAASINFEAFTYLYEGKPQKALEYLKEEANKLDTYNIPASRLNSSKMFCLNSCSWIALHTGDVDHIKELLAMRAPISEQIGNDIGTPESQMEERAREMMWEGLSIAMKKDIPGAYKKAEEMKTTLASINDPKKLQGYHFLNGYINMKEGKYEEAIKQFKQSNYKNNMYMKYMLAMAYEKAGNVDMSVVLLHQLADYNFNNVGYALVRKEVKGKLVRT